MFTCGMADLSAKCCHHRCPTRSGLHLRMKAAEKKKHLHPMGKGLARTAFAVPTRPGLAPVLTTAPRQPPGCRKLLPFGGMSGKYRTSDLSQNADPASTRR